MSLFKSQNEIDEQRQNQMYQQEMQNQMQQQELQNQMYPQGYNYNQRARKVSKAEIFNYMQTQSNCSTIKKITDTPEKIRHICLKGLHFLEMRRDMCSPNTGELIPYYFCEDCAKLFVYKEFM